MFSPPGSQPDPFAHSASLASHRIQSFAPAGTTSLTSTMPSASNWKTTPWSTIDAIFRETAAHGGDFTQRVEAYFNNELSRTEVWASLPSLNDVPAHELVDGQLVRFRCMVQDMFTPELYLASFQVRDLATGVVRAETAKYRDVKNFGAKEEVLDSGPNVKHEERQSFYCVSVPGEALWAKDGFKKQKLTEPTASCSKQDNKLKRRNDDDMEEDSVTMEADDGPTEMPPPAAPVANGVDTMDGCTVSKRPKTSETANGAGEEKNNIASLSLNLPIADRTAKAALVKIYKPENTDSPSGSYALNEVYEFVGVISMDPSMASEPMGNEAEAAFGAAERRATAPPPSLVPRLHVLSERKLKHSNPAVSQDTPAVVPAFDADELRKCRDDLHLILTKALLGDTLAAEYVLCHLIAKVYKRTPVLTLGKFSLNLFNLPAAANYGKRLSTLVQLFMDRSHYFSMTVENFNKLRFVPKKDHNANRLLAGLLQLSHGTHLIMDETVMDQGQLQADGVRNLTAVGNLISWQKVDYDFTYHQLPFEADTPCLILSEGRSMLPKDFQVGFHLLRYFSRNCFSSAFCIFFLKCHRRVTDIVYSFFYRSLSNPRRRLSTPTWSPRPSVTSAATSASPSSSGSAASSPSPAISSGRSPRRWRSPSRRTSSRSGPTTRRT